MVEHPLPKACVDVDYRQHAAVCACLLFERWTSARPARALAERIWPVAPYVPGQFYRRELPCLLATLSPVAGMVDAVVVDGYVWLGPGGVPGLGAPVPGAGRAGRCDRRREDRFSGNSGH